MRNIVLITGASSRSGARTARALADAGDTVYAGMRQTAGRDAAQAEAAAGYAAQRGVDLRVIELDVNLPESVNAAIHRLVAAHGRIDVLIHHAGHLGTGPAGALTPEQLAELNEVNVLSAQRINRAALPYLRAGGRGLVIWVFGPEPASAPYFAVEAAMDYLAVSYSAELARWGVETSIVAPGSPAGRSGRLCGEIARIVALPAGRRPYRVRLDVPPSAPDTSAYGAALSAAGTAAPPGPGGAAWSPSAGARAS
ncbi:SDR family NAD(P)-dependent oxidoreductase [Nonomuraea gerenzanensis]|uniref:SDR family NAD(P)-dependent oxidoreductase n=1 Tax=Nonomuraea gerenzanensis TaxID=93944 RepID=UPI001CDA43B2|nr:SDR family NAD(P)-dependent oxidoreductase [Nonomuraea gerenzanensis]UBU18266.1 SDR family NAD(P)-dependent oxidoreductase [Nonomuraea gerenzanensis]